MERSTQSVHHPSQPKSVVTQQQHPPRRPQPKIKDGLRRHHTAMDLWRSTQPPRNRMRVGSPSSQQQQPVQSIDGAHWPRPDDATPRLFHSTGDLMHTPPWSSSSSLVMFSGSHRSEPHTAKMPPRYETPDHYKEMGMCKCFYGSHPRIGRATTPEGLSWRRLHMSRAKLKATSTTSELLSGFAMVAMVELQINEDTKVPEWLFVMFSVCTTILVAVHIFALMISTYILPNIDAISKLDVCELVSESPHERMQGFIELAWAFSTVLGLFLFLVEVAILCWVKFWDYSFTAAIAATIIVIPVLIVFVIFAHHFYHSLVSHRCDTSIHDMQKLEDMKRQLDEVVTSPV